MERIYQMHIVPDVLPSLRPSIDLRVTFPSSQRTSYTKASRGGGYQEVEPGVYLLSEQVSPAHPGSKPEV
jgi:large subunit ribosomal protein L35